MIAKKIPNKKKLSTKKTRIYALTNYLIKPQNENNVEKCIYSNSKNFISSKHKVQQAEMLALALEAPRSRDPINHYVLSWPHFEKPNIKQVDEAVDIFLDELELSDHQIFYALHEDTENIHCHLVINRVHPISEKVIEINKGWDIKAIHKAVARIEKAQGWQPEEGALYVVNEAGDVVSNKARKEKNNNKNIKITHQGVIDEEHRKGEKSAMRIGKELTVGLFNKVESWQELHDKLSEFDMQYEKKGSGSILRINGVAVKSSSISRDAAISKLEKKLGVFMQSNTNDLPPLESYEEDLINKSAAPISIFTEEAKPIIERDASNDASDDDVKDDAIAAAVKRKKDAHQDYLDERKKNNDEVLEQKEIAKSKIDDMKKNEYDRLLQEKKEIEDHARFKVFTKPLQLAAMNKSVERTNEFVDSAWNDFKSKVITKELSENFAEFDTWQQGKNEGQPAIEFEGVFMKASAGGVLTKSNNQAEIESEAKQNRWKEFIDKDIIKVKKHGEYTDYSHWKFAKTPFMIETELELKVSGVGTDKDLESIAFALLKAQDKFGVVELEGDNIFIERCQAACEKFDIDMTNFAGLSRDSVQTNDKEYMQTVRTR
jgi:hypothetical protein